MPDDIEITLSPLCQTYSEGELSVEVEIYSGNKQDWVLEIISDDKTIIVDHTFPSDAAAYETFKSLVAESGLRGLADSQYP